MRLQGFVVTAGVTLVMMAAVACDGAEGGAPDAGGPSPTSSAEATSTSPAAAGIDCGMEEQVHGEGRNLEARQCVGDAYQRGSERRPAGERKNAVRRSGP